MITSPIIIEVLFNFTFSVLKQLNNRDSDEVFKLVNVKLGRFLMSSTSPCYGDVIPLYA